MLSITCKTAIKAVVFLASKFEPGEKTGIKEIAAYINASDHTVGKLLQTLVKEQLINSTKGPTGGFYLTERQRKNAVISIIYAIDGKGVFDTCGLGLSKCSGTHPCPIHYEYKKITDQLKTVWRENNISDLCSGVIEGSTYLAV